MIKMNIRAATLSDLVSLYNLGKATPELKVSATEEFMDLDELRGSIETKDNVFLVAEEDNKLIGFAYANAKDKDKPFKNRYACLVYLVVVPEYRKKGVATKLYLMCEQELRKKGINFIYSWANANSGEMVKFMNKQGFAEGHKYIWMDKKL